MTMSEEPPKRSTGATPVFYLCSLPGLVKVARSHGYALAVHGSLARDLDIIACPWTEDAADPEVLVEALRERVGGVTDSKVTPRPHGRQGYVIHLGGGPYIDLAVMPKRVNV